jgi:hypothetical protein
LPALSWFGSTGFDALSSDGALRQRHIFCLLILLPPPKGATCNYQAQHDNNSGFSYFWHSIEFLQNSNSRQAAPG